MLSSCRFSTWENGPIRTILGSHCNVQQPPKTVKLATRALHTNAALSFLGRNQPQATSPVEDIDVALGRELVQL